MHSYEPALVHERSMQTKELFSVSEMPPSAHAAAYPVRRARFEEGKL
jgi:hypothetical protein